MASVLIDRTKVGLHYAMYLRSKIYFSDIAPHSFLEYCANTL